MFAWVGFSIYLIFKVSIFPRSNVPTGNHQSLLAEYNIMKTKTFMVGIYHEAMMMKMMMMIDDITLCWCDLHNLNPITNIEWGPLLASLGK